MIAFSEHSVLSVQKSYLAVPEMLIFSEDILIFALQNLAKLAKIDRLRRLWDDFTLQVAAIR